MGAIVERASAGNANAGEELARLTKQGWVLKSPQGELTSAKTDLRIHLEASSVSSYGVALLSCGHYVSSCAVYPVPRYPRTRGGQYLQS